MNTYSPVLGIATASFEILAAIWVFRQSGLKTPLLRVIGLLLLFLAGYQVFEVLICWRQETDRLLLSRLAFLDITWLPPLSVVLVALVSGGTHRWLNRYAYFSLALGAIMSLWLVLDYRLLTGTICQFMIAKYNYVEPWFHIYGSFYEVTQASSFLIPAILLRQACSPRIRKDLVDILLGNLFFLLPSIYLAAILPEMFNMGLPSLMCHFAIFYAIALVRIAWREKQSPSALPV